MSIQANGQSSQNNNWETPSWLVEILAWRITGRTGFDLDAAASYKNRKAPDFYTDREDGLVQDWYGSVWLNPPWGKKENACKPDCSKKTCQRRGYHLEKDFPGIGAWEQKAFKEGTMGDNVDQVVNLCPTNNTDSSWFHDYGLKASRIIFLRGRVAFELDGVPHKNNAVACSVFVFNRHRRPQPLVESWDLKTLYTAWEEVRQRFNSRFSHGT